MRRRTLWFLGILFAIIVWTAIFLIISPSEFAEAIGGQGYLALFIIAATGGLHVFTAPSYFSALAYFSGIGLNPYLLGLLGGAGITIGDSIFFFFGRHGRAVIPDRIERMMARMRKRLERFHSNTVPLFIFLYAGFTPFPNEFATITVGLAGARFRQIILPLFVGNIILTTLICLGIGWLTGIF